LFPAATLRYREGQRVHSILRSKKNTHTIHHHGIEPANFNDGVGHTSFEVNGNYAYQFRPRFAGTYLYHCHKNTTLHFEMGMYGFLIVDPPKPEGAPGPEAPYADGGPGFVRRRDEVVPYHAEALWAVDELDSRWHAPINHQAGLGCPFYHLDAEGRPTGAENPRLNQFEPDVFLISGVPVRDPDPRLTSRPPIDDPRVAVRARAGESVLIRLLNAGYTVQRYTFHGLDAEVVDVDGRTLGRSPFCRYNRPFVIPAGEPFELTTARRYTLLLRPSAPGTYRFTVDFHDWVTGRVLGKAETFVSAG
ncbi:MAG: multicopper oxidase domain-containing protein, partial [Deferrisomatales bacterium]